MKVIKNIEIILIIILLGLLFSDCKGDMNDNINNKEFSLDSIKIINKYDDGNVIILKAEGKIKIYDPPYNKDYIVYFHIPIKFDDQIPIYYDVESPSIIDYTFINCRKPNILISARMKGRKLFDFFSTVDTIHWTSYVIIFRNIDPLKSEIKERNKYSDVLDGWLKSSDCVQTDNEELRDLSRQFSKKSKSLQEYIKQIREYNYTVYPKNRDIQYYDAFSKYKWGSTCIGYTNFNIAMLRIYKTPARSIMCIPSNYENYIDMHWYLEYFIKDTGWNQFESVSGRDHYNSSKDVKMFLTYPEDEYPKFNSSGIPCYWFSSNYELGDNNPNWATAHKSYFINSYNFEKSKSEKLYDIMDSVFCYYTTFHNLKLSTHDKETYHKAYKYHIKSIKNLLDSNIFDCLFNATNSIQKYKSLPELVTDTIYKEDFEKVNSGWTSGGKNNQWEYGMFPKNEDSSNHCWGINMSGNYLNNSDSWLMKPKIIINNCLKCVFCFWIWNDVEDKDQNEIIDPVWIEISTNDRDYFPICKNIGGVNDDPLVPSRGGWSQIYLDLNDFINKEVRIRFRFKSNGKIVHKGCYIDDLRILTINTKK